jgi:hypothetical protein
MKLNLWLRQKYLPLASLPITRKIAVRGFQRIDRRLRIGSEFHSFS